MEGGTVANTDKQNFRCDADTRWSPAMRKLEAMREAGYDIDMTKVLGDRVDWVRDSSPETIARALKLKKKVTA